MLMKFLLRLAPVACAAGVISLSGISASASYVEITYENLSQEGGIWNTPLFLGFHDGGFDSFDSGSAASASVQTIAETGSPAGLVSDIAAYGGLSAVLEDDGSPSMAPPFLFNPGSSNSLVIKLDSTDNRFLSFASMLLPSNDAFIGNDDPMAHSLFDAGGSFNDGFQIDLYGFNVWDAGTEENDTMDAPFSAIGGPRTGTVGGVVAQHTGLDNFLGTGLGDGSVLKYAFNDKTPIGRITAKRVPDTAPAAGLMGFLFLLGFQKYVSRRKKTEV